MRRQGARAAGMALSNEVARENLAAGNPKYHAGETPIEKEAALKIIEPTSDQQLKELMKMIDLMYADAGAEQRRALDFYRGQIAVDGATNAVKMRFLRRFYFWLLGRGTNDDHAKTMWGRGNVAVYNAEVAAYIEQFVEKRLQYALQLALLAQRIPVSLNGYYLYFKYIVNGELRRAKGTDGIEFWDLSNDDFLKDFEVMQQYFGEMTTRGGIGRNDYQELIKPAATRPNNAAPFGAKGTPYEKVRGHTEPYPAGHENDGDNPAGDIEGKLHLENNKTFLAKAASGIAKTHGFDSSDRRQPPPETSSKGKEEDDGTEDEEDVAAITGGNKQQIGELSRTLQEAMKKELTTTTAAAHESFLQKLEPRLAEMQHKDTAHLKAQLEELKKQNSESMKKMETQLQKGDLQQLNESIREIRVSVAAVQRGGDDHEKLVQTNAMLRKLETQRDEALQEKQKLQGHTAELQMRLKEAQEESARKALVDGKHIAKIDELNRKLKTETADKNKVQRELQEVAKKAEIAATAAAEKHSTSTLESELRNEDTARLRQEVQESKQALQKMMNDWKTELAQEEEKRVFAEQELQKTEQELTEKRIELSQKQTENQQMKLGAEQVRDAYELLTVQLQQQQEELQRDFKNTLQAKIAAEVQRVKDEGTAQFERQVAEQTAKQTAHLQAQVAALQMIAQEVGGTVAGLIVNKVEETLSNKNASASSANESARSAHAAAQKVAENAVINADDAARARARFTEDFVRVSNFINGNESLDVNEKARRATHLNLIMRNFLNVYDKSMTAGLNRKQADTLLKKYEDQLRVEVQPLLSK
jgi:hypothetical protein